jgi:two-component system, LuxR family, sensor kinase FixL
LRRGNRGTYVGPIPATRGIMNMVMTTPDPVLSSGAQPSEELQALLDAAVDGVVLIDHLGCLQVFNASAERLFGYSAEEVLGRSIGTLMTEPDRSSHEESLARYTATRVPHIIGKGREVEARRKDGSVFPVFLSVGSVPGAEPPRFAGFIQDISTRRQTEEETRRLQERLTHVSRLATVGEMSAGIAHELNQPLAAVANYAQACDRLLGLPDPDMAEIRGALKQIAAQAVRAGDIIRRLRSLARNDAMKREPTDINVLLGELTDLVQTDAKVHKVQYRLDLTAGLPQIEAHRAQLQQVVLNLVRNAFEALAEIPGKDREVTVRTATAIDNAYVEIAVCDNGPGVAQAIASRLFEPFCTSKATGTGLGLAISRTIIGSHRGTLDYHPNGARGACFVIRLPRLTSDDACERAITNRIHR